MLAGKQLAVVNATEQVAILTGLEWPVLVHGRGVGAVPQDGVAILTGLEWPVLEILASC